MKVLILTRRSQNRTGRIHRRDAENAEIPSSFKSGCQPGAPSHSQSNLNGHKRAGSTCRYYLTKQGRLVLLAGPKLNDLSLIPQLVPLECEFLLF